MDVETARLLKVGDRIEFRNDDSRTVMSGEVFSFGDESIEFLWNNGDRHRFDFEYPDNPESSIQHLPYRISLSQIQRTR